MVHHKMDTEKSENYTNEIPLNTSLVIILIIIMVIVYSIGLYLHTRIITVSKKDKAITWKLDILNSICILFYFNIAFVMFLVTYLKVASKIDICSYTATWICYGLKLIVFTGRMYIISHSLIISLMKYCNIIFQEKVRAVGKHRIENLFLFLDVLYPTMVFGIIRLIKKDETFPNDPFQEEFFHQKSITNTYKTTGKLFDACSFDEAFDEISIPYIFYILRMTFCWILSISIFLNSINILEVFFYYKIFRYMNR